MTVLGESAIRKLCSPATGDGLVDPFDEASLQPASYDLHLGREHYVDDDGGAYGVLDEGETLRIPANGISFAITDEVLALPLGVAGMLSLTMGLIKQGVMLASQPPIDPGYHGKIIALLHNLSDKPVFIQRSDHILTVTFLKVSPIADHGYCGKHQGLSSLAAELPSPPAGSVRQLRVEFEDLKKANQSRFQAMLVFVTVVIALLTLLVTFLVGFWGWSVIGPGRGTEADSSTGAARIVAPSVSVTGTTETVSVGGTTTTTAKDREQK